MDKFLFIAGMQKCGTTALSSWLVNNKVAEYLVEGVKEPYLFSRSDCSSISIPSSSGGNLWRLDSSVGYACNKQAIDRLPNHNTKIILCFRNHWDRIWSAYKMLKLDALNDSNFLKNLDNSFGSKQFDFDKKMSMVRKLTLIHYNKKARPVLIKYLNEEAARLLESNFKERLEYEISFFFSKGTLPFYSILEASRYNIAFSNISSRFNNEDVSLISMENLHKKEELKIFISEFLDHNDRLNDITSLFSLDGASINEDKPDFSNSEFDFFRIILKKDLIDFYSNIKKNNFYSDFLDLDSLNRYIY